MAVAVLSTTRYRRARAFAIARNLSSRWIMIGVLAFGVVYTLFPVLWMLSNSFKNGMAVFEMPPVWIVTDPSFSNYVTGFVDRPYGWYMLNSAIVGALTTFLAVSIGTMAGYALARFRYPGTLKFHFSYWILATRMVPPIVTIIPLFIFFNYFGLVDTRTSLVIAYTAFHLPFAVWMMKGYFQEIPRALEESAMIDGDTGFGAFWRIVVPLARPGLAATAIFTMILSWNELLFALILTETSSANTLPIGLAGRIGEFRVQWGEVSAMGIVALVPPIIVAFALQRHLVRGLSFGAVRG